jgi:pimeloyl-ACP methyl ester carboxylesterase
MSRKLIWGGALALLAALGASGGGLWSASNQLLFPSWRGATKDLSVCGAELAKYWGEGCGNLRTTHELRFSEAKVPSLNGYDMPGWLIGAADNSMGAAEGAIMLIHGGGSDRRELTRHVRFYLRRHLDVLTFDLGCHGEAPCPVPGLTYGQRESRDVLSAYLFLTDQADDAPRRFDGLMSPERSVRFTKTTPVFFIHSMRDSVVPPPQPRHARGQRRMRNLRYAFAFARR